MVFRRSLAKKRSALGLCAALAMMSALPTRAATIIQNFGGNDLQNVAKFDPALGTLNAVTAKVTGGWARYLITLDGPLNASTSYTASAYIGIYLGPLTIDGNVQGAGMAVFKGGTTEIELPLIPYVVDIAVPTDPMSAAYNALIGSGTTVASVTTDPPFNLSFGDLGGFGLDELLITDWSAIWSLVYDYTPVRAAVPEPSTWAIMLTGFGAIGGAMRRRRETVRVRFA